MKEEQPKSKCCQAPLLVATADEGTSCWICTDCRSPSDPMDEPITSTYHSKEEVEKLFEEKFGMFNYVLAKRDDQNWSTATDKDIKSFIHTIRQQDRAAIREFVESKEKDFEEKDVTIKDMKSTSLARKYNFVAGYNEAISDILAYIVCNE